MIVCPHCGTVWPPGGNLCSSCGFESVMVEGFNAWAPELAFSGAGFERRFFEALAACEATNFWFRSRNRLLLWAIGKYFPRTRAFLEIGCGTGYVLQAIAHALPNASMTGSDVFVDGLHFAAERVTAAEFVQMDARIMPYEAEFDLIGAFDVLEHIDDDKRVLANIHKALGSRGGLLVAVPQHMWLWSAADKIAHHQRRYAPGEMERKIVDAGFEVLRSTSFVSLLLSLMVLSRKFGHASADDPMAEFRITPLVNKALEAVLTAERRLIQAGVNLPIGGSRLVVARRRE